MAFTTWRFLLHLRTRIPTWTRPSMKNRRPSWSFGSNFASCRATNFSRKWLSNRWLSKPRPCSRAQSPASKSKSNAPRSRRPPARTRPPPPTAKRQKILRSRRQIKTREIPTCEITLKGNPVDRCCCASLSGQVSRSFIFLHRVPTAVSTLHHALCFYSTETKNQR